jgi:RNA polymerase sigma factor (sigma-70 family)
MIDTSETLLGRLKAENAHDAWKEFYHFYWGAILRYARKLGLNQHQAEEVLQETMVALMRILPEFAYDRRKGKFRNFLLTIVHRKSLAMLRLASRNPEVAWEEAKHEGTADPFHRGDAMEEALARWRDSLMEESIRRVRDSGRLADRTFAVFEAYAVRRRPVEEVARQFGMKENAVYQIRNRVLQRVQAEVAALMKNSGTEWQG